ncbi:protein rhomboid-like [Anopheles aquasalis]|uniref:protein rhomboid-like n=1 Tax=Anopheles aquasalis TaxID=42839 RepID=UPI00215B613F|nr:protein rhomboid-like [Anopheles aquasalis]XP_050092934.1 protein rhomboid-like [Anopheles aquasalis]
MRNMDNHHEQQQQIPLKRLNTVDENLRRQELRVVFEKYDTDGNRYLSRFELRRLIKDKKCPDIPKEVIREVLHNSDENDDGHLDFEEFFKLSTNHPYLFRDFCTRYCRVIVPRRTPDDDYESNMKVWPPPLAMIIFSVMEIIFFVVDIVKTENQNGASTHGPMASSFVYNPNLRYEVWRFLTYMFVHTGLMHLIINLVFQIFLGVALELVHCWWRVTLVYLAGVVAGSIGTSLFTPRVFLAGASGGVYALITAHIATIIMNWSQMQYAILQLYVFLAFCITDLGTSIYNSIHDPFNKVGYVAHASGALAGFFVGIGVLRNLKVVPWERKLWWCAVTIYFMLMGAGIMTHFLNPDHFK